MTGSDVLLAPETVVNLNHSAIAVLELCDGERSVQEMVEALAQRFDASAENLREDVVELLQRLADRGYVGEEGGAL